MKITFQCDLPDDYENFYHLFHANSYSSVLWKIRENLRSKLKYTELSENDYKIIEEIQEEFFRILEDEGIVLI